MNDFWSVVFAVMIGCWLFDLSYFLVERFFYFLFRYLDK